MGSPQFTKEIDDQIIKLYQNGISGHNISKQLGIDSNKVYVVIRESGAIRPPRKGNTIITAEIVDKVLKLYESGLSTSKVAKEVDIGQSTVVGIVKKAGISRDVNDAKKKGTPEQRQNAVDLYLSGISADDVAAKYNVGSDLILKWVREAGGEVRTYLKGGGALNQWRSEGGKLTGLAHPHYGKSRPDDVKKKISDSKGGKILVKCAWCDNEIEIQPSRERGINHYCSDRCESLYKSISNKGTGNPNWQGKTYPVICNYCGSEVIKEEWAIKDNGYAYCDSKCLGKHREELYLGENNPNWRDRGSITRPCSWCGEPVTREAWKQDRRKDVFCDKKCEGLWKDKYWHGPNCPSWLGGTSYLPYCYKFNSDFKIRVREFWNHKCVLCGKDESSLKRALSIHHVHGLKQESCCDDEAPRDFVPLCDSCHGKTNTHDPNKKEAYKQYFLKLINSRGGKCYLSEEEYNNL